MEKELRQALLLAVSTARAMVYRCGHPRGGCQNHCDLLVKVIDAGHAALAEKPAERPPVDKVGELVWLIEHNAYGYLRNTDGHAKGIFLTTLLAHALVLREEIYGAERPQLSAARPSKLFDAALQAHHNLFTSMNLAEHPKSCECYGCNLGREVFAEAFKRGWENTKEIRELEKRYEQPAPAAPPVPQAEPRQVCLDGCYQIVGQPTRHRIDCPNICNPYLTVRVAPVSGERGEK